MTKVYLDTSAYNRPFDDQTQPKIFLESQAVVIILQMVETQMIELVSSSVLEYENSRNPNAIKQEAMNYYLQTATAKPGLFRSSWAVDMVVRSSRQPTYQRPQLAIVEAFADLPDTRRTAGQRHQQALCLALFTLAVAAGNRGFLAIGDWLKAYHAELVRLFQPDQARSSYSTLRRALLRLDYREYSACLARFFAIQPLPGETLAVDGKVLRGSYEAISDDPTVDSHPAIMLVSAYIVERGLILAPYEVDSKTNEITALPAFIEQMALQGVVFAFDAISTQKNSPNHH